MSSPQSYLYLAQARSYVEIHYVSSMQLRLCGLIPLHSFFLSIYSSERLAPWKTAPSFIPSTTVVSSDCITATCPFTTLDISVDSPSSLSRPSYYRHTDINRFNKCHSSSHVGRGSARVPFLFRNFCCAIISASHGTRVLGYDCAFSRSPQSVGTASRFQVLKGTGHSSSSEQGHMP